MMQGFVLVFLVGPKFAETLEHRRDAVARVRSLRAVHAALALRESLHIILEFCDQLLLRSAPLDELGPLLVELLQEGGVPAHSERQH